MEDGGWSKSKEVGLLREQVLQDKMRSWQEKFKQMEKFQIHQRKEQQEQFA